MELFGQAVQSALDIFKIEFTLWGFTFSFWEVFAFTIVAGIVCWVISEIFLGD